MDFLEKLNYLMEKNHLNKSTLSKACNIPYTTIDGWYKKGYEGLKLTTLRKLADYFGTSLDYWASENDEQPTRGAHMSFAEQLKRARIAQGLTQQQVADLMGITKSTYCGYETGKRQPDVEKIKLLANILQTSGDTLLETGFSSASESKFDETLSIFKSLKPEFQEYVLDQIKKLAELQDK